MSDYGVQTGRGGRPNPYGPAPGYQRDAAYTNIFGAAPPPGRAQTMNMQSPPPQEYRAQTMSSQSAASQREYMSNPMGPPRPMPERGSPNVRGGPMQNPGSAYNHNPPMANGYYQSQRQPNGVNHQQPPAPYLPRPLDPQRGLQPHPQRMDPRMNPPQSFNRPLPNRAPLPPAAMNDDPYRSRSMMSDQRQYMIPNGYQSQGQAPPNAFRQQQYHSPASRITAQGRMIPERQDERAMSMTSWSGGGDHGNQTMSGRVIPNRKRESLERAEQKSIPPTDTRSSTMSNATTARSVSTPINPNSRSMSMASTTIPPDRADSLQHRPSVQKTVGSSTSKIPMAYPALLSKVAQKFLEHIELKDREKDALAYKLAFSGSEAVDLISQIIRTADRNLALLLGRALDAQKFYHDVTYEHRLRDSPLELYQFDNTQLEEPAVDVNGVFTLLTECYSPTCTRDQLCYSIACPRRLEQQSRLNLKPQPGLRREPSAASLHADDDDEQKLWINTVSKEISDSVPEKERRRQEVISELMYTERDFVKDLEYLRDFWMKPLRAGNIIPEQRREKFVRIVFSNALEVHSVNMRLAEALTRRQQESPVVQHVGDIFLQYVPQFGPFITYGKNQLYGKNEFERERAENSNFRRFVDEVERMKESRKLELNGYLTKPTTRLARYPLLLENILKHTTEGSPDSVDLPVAIAKIKEFLTTVNIESGKAENAFNLLQLSSSLRFAPGEYVDLKLTEEDRRIAFKGSLKKSPTDTSDIMVYLFDHALLLIKQKTTNNKREEIKVYKRPIPLELLVIPQMDEVIPRQGIGKRPSSNLSNLASRAAGSTPLQRQGAKESFPITFKHLGKPPYEVTLYALNVIQRRKWLEHINTEQTKMLERANFYNKTIICSGVFNMNNKVNCLVPLDGGRKMVYGTDTGIYVADRRPKATDTRPKRVLEIASVTQIDVLEEYRLLLVLAGKTLMSYSLEALDEGSNNAPMVKRPKKIQNHANFFRAGVCVGRHLVCAAKTSGLSTTIKVFEPMDTITDKRRRPALSQLFQGSQDALKPFKEFYIPTESSSIHFLKAKLCVATSKGFEIVSLETLETQSLLDQADTSLDFVAQGKDVQPIHIERLNGEFLLNYTDFSFFVNRNGWRCRNDWKITWEGQPTAFALSYPYLLAFEPNFIEIRHVETSVCVTILRAKNIRWMHTSTHEIIYAYEEEDGGDVVASLDFWKGSGHPQQGGAF